MSDEMKLVTFASGSTGNCALVSCGGADILIDAGISMRRIVSNLALSGLRPEDLSGILVTHGHSDHIGGLAMLIKHFNIPVYAPRTVASQLCRAAAGVENSLHIIPVGETFALAGAHIRAFHTPHDADESVGYRIWDKCVLGFATDMGHVTEEIEDGLDGADAVVIEANHDLDMLRSGSYPFPLKRRIVSPNGHLSNDDCAVLAHRLALGGTKYIVLCHLSRENNTPSLACGTVRAALGGSDVFLCAAPESDRLTLEFGGGGVCSR